MTVAFLVPAFNEAGALTRTLTELRAAAGADGTAVTVFLVDDGSEPPIEERAIPPVTPSFRVIFARHDVNLGQGAALETARQLALREDHAAYVTMDADGQHSVADALALARAVAHGADVAFGNRFAFEADVPRARRVLLRAARWFERVLTGLALEDAHNGLRAFSRRALEGMHLHQNRMAHATEIKLRVSRAPRLTVVELPVRVRYTAETLAKGQSAIGALDIVRDLLQAYLFGNDS